eukprot:CAMPEP_0114990126 /NCGR_PEP_ID=MMETSP0216-20121206/10603_1 /TAXON_ID=223996 /ORGANISM="Protocruzia adherens, Strain Boccale" /LENGTH=202 /DNA_ID=CAMNT_0002353227 /DNA_START=2504 /DNA_END=3112 /DNA_ORIENTATION=-
MCPETAMIVQGISTWIHSEVEATIDPESAQPRKVSQCSREYQDFCELSRVVQLKDLPMKTKADMISKPSMATVHRFLHEYFMTPAIPVEVTVVAWILLKRFLKATQWGLRSTIWRVLIIVATRLAQKLQESPLLRLTDVCSLYPLFSKSEFAALEMTFLEVINFDCKVTMIEFYDSLVFLTQKSLNFQDTFDKESQKKKTSA